jgi:hypothetical protein
MSGMRGLLISVNSVGEHYLLSMKIGNNETKGDLEGRYGVGVNLENISSSLRKILNNISRCSHQCFEFRFDFVSIPEFQVTSLGELLNILTTIFLVMPALIGAALRFNIYCFIVIYRDTENTNLTKIHDQVYLYSGLSEK